MADRCINIPARYPTAAARRRAARTILPPHQPLNPLARTPWPARPARETGRTKKRPVSPASVSLVPVSSCTI
jgi:hypothetical protein